MQVVTHFEKGQAAAGASGGNIDVSVRILRFLGDTRYPPPSLCRNPVERTPVVDKMFRA